VGESTSSKAAVFEFLALPAAQFAFSENVASCQLKSWGLRSLSLAQNFFGRANAHFLTH